MAVKKVGLETLPEEKKKELHLSSHRLMKYLWKQEHINKRLISLSLKSFTIGRLNWKKNLKVQIVKKKEKR